MVVELFYCPQSPPSQPIRMILRELGIEFKEIRIDVMSGKPKAKEFMEVNPRGKVPAIRDGSFTLAESRVIASYLCNKYEPPDKTKPLFPKDAEKGYKMAEALHAQRDADWYIDKYTNADDVWVSRAPGPVPQYKELAKRVLNGMEADLLKHDFLAADHLTVLDFFALTTSELLYMADQTIWNDYPRVVQWRKRMSELPYYQEVMAEPNARNKAFYEKVCEEIFAQKG